MGLNNCLQFIRNKYPHLLQEEHISKYAYQRVIVDIASYIYKFACIYGIDSNRWMHAFINLMSSFKLYNVHPVVVFDGKPPVEKDGEIDTRKEKKKQSLEKIKRIEEAYSNYLENKATEEDKNLIDSILDKTEIKEFPVRRLLIEETNNGQRNFTSNELEVIKQHIIKQKNSVVYISPLHFQNMKDTLTLLGIPYIQAEYEAEGLCCFLVKNNYGSAVMSCDTDCIAHGATNIIFSYDSSSGKIIHLNINELYEEWELDEVSIRDFGILIGCDYNRKQKIAKIGPVNALRLLQTYNCIENIPDITFDLNEINKMRDLFNIQSTTEFFIPKLDMDIKGLEEHCRKYNMSTDFISTLIQSKNNPTKRVIIDDDNIELAINEELENEL